MTSVHISQAKVAVVTGAGGFLGGRLASKLAELGWHVTALHRGSVNNEDLKLPGVDLKRCDILDPASLRDAMPDGTVVFHVAGDTTTWRRHRSRQWQVNVEGTHNVLRAAEQARAARFVHTSTVSAYGRHRTPISEATRSAAPRSRIMYERSKWAAEEHLRSAVQRGLDAVIVAPSAIVGPGDRHGWSSLILQIARGEAPVIPPGRATFNHVDDVVAAHIAAAEHGVRGESYLLPGTDASFVEFFGIVADEVGTKLSARRVPAPVLRAMAGMMQVASVLTAREPALTPEMAALLCANTVVQSRKAVEMLDYRSLPLSRAIADACQWLRAQNMLSTSSNG